MTLLAQLPEIPRDRPVLIAGPTASGKSALAMEIAARDGGVIVNADAAQVFDCWRIVTARPDPQDEAALPHALYGHVPWNRPYSAGQWLRDLLPLLRDGPRPIIVGGTGLYFLALTEGMADIPATPAAIREAANARDAGALAAELDPRTAARIDLANPARVRRAWEVLRATGRGLADWQDETPPPALPLAEACALVIDAPKPWLTPRIERRFDQMIAMGALDEVAAMADRYDPGLPSCKAIGVPELMAHVRGGISLDEARARAIIATRQFAKRQRTWFRARMGGWTPLRAG